MKAISWYARAAVHAASLRNKQAVRAAEIALTLDPHMIAARWVRCMSLLRLGRWPEAWADHEALSAAREQRPDWPRQWNCRDSIEGKTLLIWGEGGLGDIINFVRFVPVVKERFKPDRIVLEVQWPLVELLREFPAVDEVIAREPNDPRTLHARDAQRVYDLHVSLWSLPYALSLSVEDL